MFGMGLGDVRAMKPTYMGPGMWAMSILSDLQERLAIAAQHDVTIDPDLEEEVRQVLNVAKYWIQESRDVDSDDPRDR